MRTLAAIVALLMAAAVPGGCGATSLSGSVSASGVPAGTASASASPPTTAAPTPFIDSNMPLPVRWGALALPDLPQPWALGRADDNDPPHPATIEVLKDGSRVGYVLLWVYLPGAWPGYDLRGRGFQEVSRIAHFMVNDTIADRAGGGLGMRADPELIRVIPFGRGSGVWSAIRDVKVATGSVVARYVDIWHWDGRALWRVATTWPPDPEGIGPPMAFDALADQEAFDPLLEDLVANLGLPIVLPTPVPVQP